MPGFDGTGPRNTNAPGRGLGNCNDKKTIKGVVIKNNYQPGPGRGLGRGRGRGMGRGLGRP
jgi:hypothetical protein